MIAASLTTSEPGCLADEVVAIGDSRTVGASCGRWHAGLAVVRVVKNWGSMSKGASGLLR